MVDTNIEFRTPLLLAPDALQDYGKGRKCEECKVNKVNRYQPEPICFTCQDEKIDKDLASARRAAAFSGKLAGPDTRVYNLRTYRIKLGLSQRELAKRSGANSQYLSQLERGERGCGSVVSEKLARALGVTVTELRGTNGAA